MLLAIQWKYKRMQWSTTPNYLAYCGQESVDKVKAIQKNQKTAESRNPPLSQKRLQIKINYSSVPYPPVAPICFVCQVKDVLFYFSVKGFYGQVSISDTEKCSTRGSQGWYCSLLRLKNGEHMFPITFFSAPSSCFFFFKYSFPWINCKLCFLKFPTIDC